LRSIFARAPEMYGLLISCTSASSQPAAWISGIEAASDSMNFG
jgi:hypothetical protein